ncbi:MAG: Holliday junction DNA helicase RuvA [Bdellovibrionales bacterium RBG_16_40_8]|nr:MAG: Holliday junction DNA helicase RuvA [Bdellovibrionales bacterium RBG_16_40_8]
MIAFLQGSVIPHGEDSVIINVRGVGYEVLCSAHTRGAVSDQTSAQLWIYTYVREDILQLFGFATKAEKELFLSLIKVSGIGPKVAMKILSGAPLDAIIQMIDEGDIRRLSQLPKVGKKTAEQIVLALKGKIILEGNEKPRSAFTARANIVSALVNLGFKIQDVEKVVEQMEPSIDFEDGLRKGLSSLSGAF